MLKLRKSDSIKKLYNQGESGDVEPEVDEVYLNSELELKGHHWSDGLEYYRGKGGGNTFNCCRNKVKIIRVISRRRDGRGD